MRAGSPQKQIDGSFQILGHQCWPPGETRLMARSVFSCPDENAHEAGGHRSANVGLNIVADHHDILGGALNVGWRLNARIRQFGRVEAFDYENVIALNRGSSATSRSTSCVPVLKLNAKI
jgi:hypothetical protein